VYRIHLEQFEGPLDLLLYFIRRDEIDIYDIPIARITAEYMETLEMMQQMNLAKVGDFIVMAATLMRLKAKMLLPRGDEAEDEEYEDPRTELVRQLLEYQRFKEAAETLDRLAHDQMEHFTLGQEPVLESKEDTVDYYLKDISLFHLAQAFKDALERVPVLRDYELQRDPVKLDDQRAYILRSFDGDRRTTFSALIQPLKSRLEMIVTFLALLEMIRSREVAILQKERFGEIELRLLKSVS
jgi:segregation and condensation protein A